VSVAVLSLCWGFGWQYGFIAQYPPPPVTMAGLALVIAVIVTIPTDHVAMVRHVAPMGISGLVGMACSYVNA
jgi:hypothetical protein